jgi:AcrR family transcriptional regulator
MTTFRDRRKQQTAAELRAIAGAHLRTMGAAGLSLRAIAREAGMAPSAVYRYFPSRDDLLTDLLVAAFTDHAEAVEAVARPHVHDGDPVAALRAAFRGYRRWAVEHPAEFGLVYGAPVPGYVAPADRTLAPGTRIGAFLLGLLIACDEAGRLDKAVVRARQHQLGQATTAQLTAAREALGTTAPVPLLALGLEAHMRLHGFVSMEAFGQLAIAVPDGEAYYEEVLNLELTRCGLPAYT